MHAHSQENQNKKKEVHSDTAEALTGKTVGQGRSRDNGAHCEEGKYKVAPSVEDMKRELV